MKRTIISGDYYNALYEDDVLKHQGEDDYLNVETLLTIFPDAELYSVPLEMYDELIGDHDGYPNHLSEFPLDVCEKYK